MMSTARGYRLGVDVGGTFTDICVITPTGLTVRAKVPTNTTDQSIAVKEGVDQVRAVLKSDYGWDGKFDYIHHGTTTATNAILEGKGVKTGLVVTKGHKDILSFRRSQIPGGLGAWINFVQPEPIVPLERTVGAPERVSIQGEVVKELDREAFRASLADLKKQKPQAISVSLLNSFANNVHEEATRGILLEEFGAEVEVVTSTEILPEIQEYERTVTTAANALVKPIVKKYMTGLQSLLKNDTDTIRILKSDGDLTSTHLAGEMPVSILMSGPAGGVIGVGHVVSKNTPFKNLITLDMGGTSTDCALIPGTNAILRRETVVGPLTVKAPSVDVRTVGAGGGSIAHYTPLTNALRVGPESAGSTPGPAAYGKGGKLATVTDANLALGYLPSVLLGGKFKLDVAAATTAVEDIAKQMGMSITDTAEGIINLVNETMYGALRLVSVEQGYDPRDFALVAFGGAGPLHANAIGKLLGAFPVIVPPAPGILCAQGDATTKMSHEQSMTYIRLFSTVSSEELRVAYKDLAEGCSVTMKKSLVDEDPALNVSYEADMRYQGQALTLTVQMTAADLEKKTETLLEQLRAKFAKAHEQQFSFSLGTNIDLEIMRLRVKATDASPEVQIQPIEDAPNSNPPETAIMSKSMITVNDEHVEAIFWDRDQITKKGYKVFGPCVVTEMDSNTLILPGYSGEIDGMGNILIRPIEEKDKQWEEEIIHTPESAKKYVEENPLVPTLISSSLGSIRREMDTLMLRCAMSPAIREQQDEFNVITNPAGKMLVGQFGSFIGQFLDSWKGTIEEGDVFVTNDVYQTKGAVSHLNDVIVLLPIHHNGKVVGWAANFGHLTDVQGKVPGSMSINASTIFEDGLQIPSVKLYAKGEYNQSLVDVFCRNSRIPEWFQSDLTALVAACRTAAARVCELCDRYGTEVYHAACDSLLLRCRTAISELIDNKIGTERSNFTDFIDDDGNGIGPYAITCAMQKVGSKLVFDWDGTSPQSGTSMNYYLSTPMFKIFISYFLLAVYDPHSVVNDGPADLIELKIPEGSILRPVRPAALSCRTHLLGRVMDIIQALFGQRNPAFRSAAGFSDSPHLFYSGFKPTGDWFLLYQIGFGGVPARPIGDGPDCHCLFPAIKSIPTENIELYFPLIIEANESVADSGGAGFYRGGNAQRTMYRFLCEGEVSIHDDRWLTKPWGVNGGEPGTRSRKGIYRNHSYGTDREEHEAILSKCDHIRVKPGDVLEWITWGGGGLGDPLTRPPEIVAKEVHRKLVTIEGAAKNYGVVMGENWEPDTEKTEALRKSIREKRKDGWDSVTYNWGWAEDDGGIESLVRYAEKETGLKAPTPHWEKDPYGPHVGLPYVKEWFTRMRKEGYGGWKVLEKVGG